MDGEIKWNLIAKVRIPIPPFDRQRENESNLKNLSLEIVKQKGLENITVDELVQEITPKGRGQYTSHCARRKRKEWEWIFCLALVPDSIKKEMLARLRNYLSKHEELWDHWKRKRFSFPFFSSFFLLLSVDCICSLLTKKSALKCSNE